MADISKIKALNGTTYNIKDTVARQDISGKVNGPANSNNNTVALFDGTTGKTIKDSGLTIGRSVPADAVFLPTVTTSDNGKVLGVVNGAWGAANLSGATVSKISGTTDDYLMTMATPGATVSKISGTTDDYLMTML